MKNIVSKFKNLKLDFSFKIMFMFVGLLSFNGLTANSTLLTIVSYVFTAIGGVCVLNRLLNYKKYIQTRGLFLLILFLVSYFISAICTIKYGVVENVKAMIWLVMQFLLLYTYDINQTKQQIKKEASILGAIFVGYTFIFSLLSIGCFILNCYFYRVVNGVGTLIGYIWNRLWGFYSDPNRGAIYALISIFISLCALYKVKKSSLKVFLVINTVVQIAYIAFSDSRTGLVSAIVGLVFAGGLTFYKTKYFEKMKTVGKVVATMAVCIGIVLAFMGIFKGSISIGNTYMSAVHNPNSVLYYWMDEEKRQNRPSETPSTEEDSEADTEIDVDENLVGRPIEDLGAEGGDISNRRFAIWASGVEVFLTTPIVGTSFRNIVPYAQEHVPDTYIVNNDVNPFSSMHNMFVDILVSQGLIGMIIFLAFMILVLYIIFKRIFKKDKEDFYWCATFLSIIVPIVVSSVFYSEIVYINTANAVVFWIALGYLINYIQKDERNLGGNNE